MVRQRSLTLAYDKGFDQTLGALSEIQSGVDLQEDLDLWKKFWLRPPREGPWTQDLLSKSRSGPRFREDLDLWKI